MKILDCYINRKFVTNFMILLVILMLLTVLIDVLLEMDNYLKVGWV